MNLAFDMDNRHFTCRVAAIICTGGQILLAKHKDHSCYYTVGGKVRINESTEDAVIREVREETGINYEIENLAFVQERFFTVDGQEQHEIVFFYVMKENGETKNLHNKYTDQGEDEQLLLLDIDDLGNLDIVPSFLKDTRFDNLNGLRHIVTRE